MHDNRKGGGKYSTQMMAPMLEDSAVDIFEFILITISMYFYFSTMDYINYPQKKMDYIN